VAAYFNTSSSKVYRIAACPISSTVGQEMKVDTHGSPERQREAVALLGVLPGPPR
jgi:hypothetical protein